MNKNKLLFIMLMSLPVVSICMNSDCGKLPGRATSSKRRASVSLWPVKPLKMSADDMLHQDPVAARELAVETWFMALNALGIQKHAQQQRKESPDKQVLSQSCQDDTLLAQDQIFAEYEKHCAYYALTDETLKTFGWHNSPQEMSCFVTRVAGAVSNELTENPTKRLNIVSLGAHGFLTDLIILQQVLQRHPNAAMRIWYDAPLKCSITSVESMDDATQEFLHNQFFRWFKTRHPNNTKTELKPLKRGESSWAHGDDVPDIVYMRNTNPLAVNQSLPVYKKICKNAIDGVASKFKAFMIINELGTITYRDMVLGGDR